MSPAQKRRCKRVWRKEEPWPDRGRDKNHVWTVDFILDRTADSKLIMVQSVLDKYTRECVALPCARSMNAQMRYVVPGSPWQNGCVESFHDKLRDEFLQMEIFVSVAEARVLLENWRIQHNRIRPHSSLEYLTPEAFAATSRGADFAPPHLPRRGAKPSRLSPC